MTIRIDANTERDFHQALRMARKIVGERHYSIRQRRIFIDGATQNGAEALAELLEASGVGASMTIED